MIKLGPPFTVSKRMFPVILHSAAAAASDLVSEICQENHLSELLGLVEGYGHHNEPPKSLVMDACAFLTMARVVVWIAGPPGVGKSVLSFRSRTYGMLGLDAEDRWLHRSAVPHMHHLSLRGLHAHLSLCCANSGWAPRLFAGSESHRASTDVLSKRFSGTILPVRPSHPMTPDGNAPFSWPRPSGPLTKHPRP